jgi:hypothetical protein
MATIKIKIQVTQGLHSVVMTPHHVVLTEIEGETALTGVMVTPIRKTKVQNIMDWMSPNGRNDSVSGPTFPSETNLRIQSEVTELNGCQKLDKVEPFVLYVYEDKLVRGVHR